MRFQVFASGIIFTVLTLIFILGRDIFKAEVRFEKEQEFYYLEQDEINK